MHSWQHAWGEQDRQIALRRLQALYTEAPQARRAAAWRSLLWPDPDSAPFDAAEMSFTELAVAGLQDPAAAPAGKNRLMQVLLGAVAEGHAAAVRLHDAAQPPSPDLAKHTVGGPAPQPPAPRQAAVNLRGHVAGAVRDKQLAADLDTVVAAAQAQSRQGAEDVAVTQAFTRLLQGGTTPGGGTSGGGMGSSSGSAGTGFMGYYSDSAYGGGASFSDDYAAYNSAGYYLGADDVNAIFDDAAFGSSFLNSFFGDDFLAAPGTSTSPYGSFDIYAGGDPLQQNFFSDDTNLAPDWDRSWNPASGEAPPIFGDADATFAASTGTSASFSYVDYNSLQGGTANVGVTLLSDILAVSSADGETKLMRDLGGVPISGGRHELRRVVSTFQTSPAGGLGAATTTSTQGYQPLIISDRAVLTTPQLRRRYNNAMRRASRQASERQAPYFAFHPDANGRTPVPCVTQLVTEVNGTLAAASRNSTQLFRNVDTKFNETFGPVPAAAVSQFTGSAAIWRSAVVRMRAFSSTTSVIERGWEDIIGEMGGTLTLLMAAGNGLVALALGVGGLCKKQTPKAEGGDQAAPAADGVAQSDTGDSLPLAQAE